MNRLPLINSKIRNHMMNTLQFISVLRHCRQLLCRSMAVASLAITALASFAGCASTPEKSGAIFDQQVNFNDYHTFGWYDDPVRDVASQPLTLVETAIRDAIATEMQRKGYVDARASSPADLLISYQAASTEKVKNNPFRIGIGIGSYGSGGGASIGTSTSGVSTVTEGSLTIHAIDAVRNAEVWQSAVSRELGKGAVDPEAIRRIVAEVFTEFPARTVAQ
jgi:hypothetical protein